MVKKNIELEDAGDLALRVLDMIEDHLERGAIAGSIRRRKPIVQDIDLVVIPKPGLGEFPNMILGTLQVKMEFDPNRYKLHRAGPKIIQVEIEGVQVDIYRSNPKSWGVHLLRWTGSTEHNIKLCTRARSLGLKLAVSEGLFKDGEIVASETEEDIFRALHMDYIPPEERER
jgi:DNA polymerase (family 10)